MNEEWIEQMRQKMADYQWPAPELSWDELDQALTANNPRKPRLLWLRRLAAAAVLLLIVGVGYWSLLRNNTKENHGDWHNDSSVAKIRVPVPVILDSTAKIRVSVPMIHNRKTGEVACLDPESKTILSSSMSKPDTVNTAASTEKEQSHAVEEKVKPVEPTRRVIYPADLHQRKHLDNRLTAKVYISSTMTGSHQTNSFYDPYGDSLVSAKTNHNAHHYQPVRFGLSLRYCLNDRWSLEGGLVYTRLSSDITTMVDGVTSLTEQRLNYIGLPLNISYNLWKSNHFGLYVTAGGMIEKSLDTTPWQFSINEAVGAEYKLTDIFSLYAEPGLGYYFKDGSTTSTIYQDRPLNFNLSIGIRFNLK